MLHASTERVSELRACLQTSGGQVMGLHGGAQPMAAAPARAPQLLRLPPEVLRVIVCQLGGCYRLTQRPVVTPRGAVWCPLHALAACSARAAAVVFSATNVVELTDDSTAVVLQNCPRVRALLQCARVCRVMPAANSACEELRPLCGSLEALHWEALRFTSVGSLQSSAWLGSLAKDFWSKAGCAPVLSFAAVSVDAAVLVSAQACIISCCLLSVHADTVVLH